MNVYEIRYGGDITEVIQADARGIRSGKIPPAVRVYAQARLNHLIRFGAKLRSVEVSLLELPNVSLGTPGSRVLLDVISHAEIVRDNVTALG